MSLTKPSMAVNIITSLGTTSQERGLTEAAFKAKFDETPAAIKTYLNDVLTAELDSALSSAVTTTGTQTISNKSILVGQNTQTASYTPTLTDAGKSVLMNVSTDNNFTVPLNSSVAFPIGTTIEIVQYGLGKTSIAATGGVTIYSVGDKKSLTAQYASATITKIATDSWTLTGMIETPVSRYGFKRAKATSDPTARITYLYDAVGMTPAYMDFGGGSFNYGSWSAFVNSVSRPVMLKTDGTVDYELSKTDMTKKVDNTTASDISNTAYDGNAMIEFSKFKWVRRYEDASYEYVIFSDIQYDPNYNAYAHTNAIGTINSEFYWGAFKGSYLTTKIRSFADQAVGVSQTRNTEVTYATANGSGYNTIYKSGWDYICDLLTLISKSDDSQTKFGAGRSLATNTTAIATGTLKAQPYFKGDAAGINDVKVFGIEGFWGNVWEGMAGLILNSGIKTKMTPPYNFDGTGYTATGVTPGGTTGSFVNTASVTDASGYVPKTASGSGTTYYCDGLWFSNAQIDYALVGGDWSNALLGGCRSVNLGTLASYVYVTFGSRLSYNNPA